MKKKLIILLLCFVLMHLVNYLQAKTVKDECYVTEVISGEMFRCSNHSLVKIWGIQAVSLPLENNKKQVKENISAKEYLKSYILKQTLICKPRGLLEGGIIGQCIKDLKVKSIDIADPLLIGGYAKELKNITKGYYSNPNRPRSE